VRAWPFLLITLLSTVASAEAIDVLPETTQPKAGVVSPDGQYEIRTRGDHLDLWRNNRLLRQLAPGRPASYRPAFSPDSKRILFETFVDGQYHVIEAKVGGGERIVKALPSLFEPMQFSPDGKWVYLVSTQLSLVENEDRRTCLMRLNDALTDQTVLACHEIDHDSVTVAFAADKSHVAWVVTNKARASVVTFFSLPDGQLEAEQLLPDQEGGSAHGLVGGRFLALTTHGLTIVERGSKRRILLGERTRIGRAYPGEEWTEYTFVAVDHERILARRARMRATTRETATIVKTELVSIDPGQVLDSTQRGRLP